MILAAIGCSSDTLGFENFAQARARALCQQRARCCSESPDYNVDACTQAEAEGYQRWLDELRADYDALAADGCVAAYRASCSEVDQAVLEACAHVFKGRLPLHSECTSDEECAPTRGQLARCQESVVDDFEHMVAFYSTECVPDDFATANFVPAELGQACDAMCVESDGETHCSGVLAEQGPTPACFEAQGLSCVDARCQPLPTPGEPCLLARCDQRQGYCSAMDRCVPYELEGGPCGHARECGAQQYCSDATSTCAALECPTQCRHGDCSLPCIPPTPELCERSLPTAH